MLSISIEQRVVKILGKALDIPVDRIDLISFLVDDLGANSLDIIDIILKIEYDFNIIISDEEIIRVQRQTVQYLIDYVTKHSPNVQQPPRTLF